MTSLNGAAETVSGYPPGGAFQPVKAIATYEEERREVFASILDALTAGEPDPDCRAACGYLLRHLAGAVRRPVA